MSTSLSYVYQRAIDNAIQHKRDQLTACELSFLNNLRTTQRISGKQDQTARAIFRRVQIRLTP